jgi:hypothetical protein
MHSGGVLPNTCEGLNAFYFYPFSVTLQVYHKHFLCSRNIINLLKNMFWHDKETNVINKIVISLFFLKKIINCLFCYHKTKCHIEFSNIVIHNLASSPFNTPALSGIRLSEPNCLLVFLLKHPSLTFL